MSSIQKFSYDSMGTSWEIVIWDNLTPKVFDEYKKEIQRRSHIFDNTYSRFIKSSLVWQIAQESGTFTVSAEFVEMLSIYKKLFELSGGKMNPLIGFTLSDLGYDADYTLKARGNVSATPDFNKTVEILSPTSIKTNEPVLIDIGALGKGYFVDQIAKFLSSHNVDEFLVNGSGDIYYKGSGLTAGLEHPTNKAKVIGSIEIVSGALCASGSDRRKWGEYNHIIDPTSLTSSNEILSTWVLADSAVIADGLSTALFFVAPEAFSHDFNFEYCILNKEMQIKKSNNFNAKFY